MNLDLQVGSVTEVVQVSGAAPLVDTTRSDLGGVVTGDDIANLPTLNRTFANIAVMMPEARPAGGFDPTKTRVGNFAMNGGDGRQLDVNVDGGDNKDNVVGSMLQNFAYESIQEFQVLQHRWTAESGRAVGGVVNVISKSGTNQLKGSGLLTFRNDSLVAKDFFQERGAIKPAFERWEYGGSIGGPIVRDNLFFFGALERFDEPGSETPIRSEQIFQEVVGDSRIERGAGNSHSVRRHAPDREDRPSSEQLAEHAVSVLVAEELVAERSGGQPRGHRFERRQHEHERPVLHHRQAHDCRSAPIA